MNIELERIEEGTGDRDEVLKVKYMESRRGRVRNEDVKRNLGVDNLREQVQRSILGYLGMCYGLAREKFQKECNKYRHFHRKA